MVKEQARLKKQWNGGLKKQNSSFKRVIWSSTPHDIQLSILRFLPVASLCRFRCVSRSWKSAIATTIPSRRSGELFLSLRSDVGFCIGVGPWRDFPLAVIPKEAPSPFVTFVSTSGGLVLASHGRWLSVHNPFVPGCARVLGCVSDIRGFQQEPPSEAVAFTGIQALASSTKNDGKIAFAAVCVTVTSGKLVRVHVFDSRRWSWVVECARVPGVGHGHKEELLQGYQNFYTLLLRDDTLYFLTICENGTRCLRSLNFWDPEHTCKTLATWVDLPLNLHQNSYGERWKCNHPSLISCQGRLMLVNVIPGGAVGFVYLDEESGRWREVTSFSMDVLPGKVKKTNLRETSRPGCVWAAGTPESSKVALHFVTCFWGCIFDLADSTWRSASIEDMPKPFHPSFRTL